MEFSAVCRRNEWVNQPASEKIARYANEPATSSQAGKIFHEALSPFPSDDAAMGSNMNVVADFKRGRNVCKVVDGHMVANRDELRISDYHVGANPHVHTAPLQ